jgi:hypothetical protein
MIRLALLSAFLALPLAAQTQESTLAKLYQDPSRTANALTKAELFWGKHADVRGVVFTPLQSPIASYWDAQKHIIYLNVQEFSDDRLAATIAHEYGHALGKGHSDDPENVMYPSGIPRLPSSASTGDSKFSTSTGLFTVSSVSTTVSLVDNSSLVIYSDGPKGSVGASIKLPEKKAYCEGESLLCHEEQPDWTRLMSSGATWKFFAGNESYSLSGSELLDLLRLRSTKAKKD